MILRAVYLHAYYVRPFP